MNPKQAVGEAIARDVKDGALLGIGTGSTVDAALVAIGDRIQKEGLSVRAVTTSVASTLACKEHGISDVLDMAAVDSIDWGFDGADAVDPQSLICIKGGGGAMFQEKALAVRCKRWTIVAGEDKLTDNLADAFLIPVEVVPAQISIAEAALKELGATHIELRSARGATHGPVHTAQGNVIFDTRFPAVTSELEVSLSGIVGVLESGVFARGYAADLLVGKADGSVDRYEPQARMPTIS